MINIDENVRTNLLENSIYREIILRFPGDDDIPDIDSGSIVSESFELTESICDGSEFSLGGGIAGQMIVEVFGAGTSLQDKKVEVYIRQTYSDGNLFPDAALYPGDDLFVGMRESTVEQKLFTGKVYSCKRKKNNRRVSQIIAYNALYYNSKINVSATTISMVWRGNETLSEFISALIDSRADEAFTISGNPTAAANMYTSMSNLRSDLISKAAGNGLSLTDILSAYAELNAAFLVCTRGGNLFMKSLCEFESVTSDHHTKKIAVSEVIGYYSSLEFEEFVTAPISYIRFKYNDNQNYAFGYSADYSWYLSDNVLLRMMTNADDFVRNYRNNDINYIFYNLYSYRPYKADVFGRWWLEPGDRIQFQTGDEDVPVVDSYVFSRTIKGINGMQVTIEAKGKQYIGKKEDE